MATQDPTTNYNWNLPTVGGDAGSWGTALNSIIGDDATGIDTVVKAVSDVANAALAKAGGTMTGELKMLTEAFTVSVEGSQSGAVTLDCDNGNMFTMTLSGNVTSVALSNLPASGTFFGGVIEITGASTYSVTWGAAWKWPSGTAPTQTQAGVDVYYFYTTDGGTTIYAVRCMEDMQ
jgi:hypothetical protein